MDRETRRVAHGQRDRCYRRHHGWVRAKRCGFCERLSHVDEMGVLAPPWRVRGRRGEEAPAHSCLTWYCCTQCAQHLDVTQRGWHRRAPRVVPHDAVILDLDPDWMHVPAERPRPRRAAKSEPEQKPAVETKNPLPNPPLGEGLMAFGSAGRADMCWADEVEDDPGEVSMRPTT